MRDVIVTYRPSVRANRQRAIDTETGEVKLVWGLVGIRLRTPEDDFTDEDPTPTDPVDPVQPDTESPQESHAEAVCDGDPADSQKVSAIAEMEIDTESSIAESFSPDDRITGSGEVEVLAHSMLPCPDPVPVSTVSDGQQTMPLFVDDSDENSSNVLRYFPDLAQPSHRKRTER